MCTLFYNILCFYAFGIGVSFVIIWFLSHEKTNIRLLSAFLVGITSPISLPSITLSLFSSNGQHFYIF
ncbi:GhoT/OrtT family toxin [Escherichia coli]